MKMQGNSQYLLYNVVLKELYVQDPSDQEIAKKAGVSPTTIRNWRIGEVLTPRIDTLTKVAEALGIKVTIKVRKR